MLPVIRHSGLLGAAQAPRHLRGTVPSPPYQGPRHLWLGTEAPPLCRLCGCSDHGEGVVHAGSAVPILVPPRMAATWPVPPLCQGPRHLQEGASVPAWGLAPPGLIRPLAPEASRGVGVSAFSQFGQSCGRWSPRQMRVRPHLPGQRPRIQLLQTGLFRWGVLPFPLFPGLPLDFPLPLDLFLPF